MCQHNYLITIVIVIILGAYSDINSYKIMLCKQSEMSGSSEGSLKWVE